MRVCLVARFDTTARQRRLRIRCSTRGSAKGASFPYPELMGGFGVPRPAAEIAFARSGAEVLAGGAHVIDLAGADVTPLFVAGAQAALAAARERDCRFALLIDGSPSCGSQFIYDGSFSGRRHAGAGVTAALLRAHGIAVFSHSEIETLGERLARDDAA